MLNRRSFVAGLLAMPVSRVAAKETRVSTMSEADADALARTMWGEARGEHVVGQIAVAHVVFNRVASPLPLFERDVTIRRACLRGDQFTCWEHHRVMRELRYGSDEYEAFRAKAVHALWLWRLGKDYSNSATNYVRVSRHMPRWTRKMHRVARIGEHVFFSPRKGIV